MQESSAKILIISGSRVMTNLMQCADIFQKDKVIGTLKIINVKYKENEKANLKRAAILIDKIKQSLEEEEIVSLIHVLEATNGTVTVSNQGEVLPYIDKTVRCVSDGYNWFLLSDWIEHKTGLKVITDEHKFITGVGIKTDSFMKIKVPVAKKQK